MRVVGSDIAAAPSRRIGCLTVVSGGDAPWIAAQAMTTDTPSSFEEKSMIKMVGFEHLL